MTNEIADFKISLMNFENKTKRQQVKLDKFMERTEGMDRAVWKYIKDQSDKIQELEKQLANTIVEVQGLKLKSMS